MPAPVPPTIPELAARVDNLARLVNAMKSNMAERFDYYQTGILAEHQGRIGDLQTSLRLLAGELADIRERLAKLGVYPEITRT